MAKKPQGRSQEGSTAQPSHANRAWDLVRSTFEHCFAIAAQADCPEERAFVEAVPDTARADLQMILDSYERRASYRIAAVIQMAFALTVDESFDLTKRPPGTRGQKGVAGKTGQLLAANHIVSVEDAYQNIAKNTDNMVRGNFDEFDRFLTWASEPGRTKAEIRSAFDYACLMIARTSRPVSPMPEVDPGKLTFATVMSLFNEMLSTPSGGAHEQYISAALLEARADQADAGQRVETKPLNASDQSAGSPADIQVKSGSKVDEAFEVTANQWSEKVDAASQKIRDHDLSRLHILARVGDYEQMLRELLGRGDDISVLQLREFIAVIVAELRRASRAAALRRLYQLLDRLQPDISRVNAYVNLLHRFGIVDTTADHVQGPPQTDGN